MAYTWTVVVAGISFLVYFTKLPFSLVPVLLFGAFLASGGKSFPRIFFRTFFRDLRAVYLATPLVISLLKHQRNNDTIADIFRQTVSKYPQKTAFVYEQKTWKFQEVEDFANRIANYFKSQGYKTGDKVALLLESCPEFVCIWLGLSKLGVITALINTNLKCDSLWHCVSAVEVKAIIFGTDFSGAVNDIHDQVPKKTHMYYFGPAPCSVTTALNLIKELKRSSLKPPDTDHTKSFNDVLMYIYTSGTTGHPKPAVITNKRYGSYSPATAGRRILQVVQYIGEICRYLLAQPYRPSERQHWVRLAVGNGLRPQLWKEFQSRFGIQQIGENYGSTEGNIGFLNIDNTPGACGFVSVIAPTLMTTKFIKVDTSTGDLLRGENDLAVLAGPGEPGLAVGKIVKVLPFHGYVNQEETSKKIGHDILEKGNSYFLSGDLLVKDEYGYVYFYDRIGDTFRWRGENVSTAEVEATMSKILGLRDVVVYGVQVPGTEGRAGMAAVVDSESNIDLSRLVQGLNEQLPHYAHPRFLRIVDSVAITGTFKFQKNKLREQGFDVRKIQDKLLYYDVKEGQYLSLHEDTFAKINHGKIRM